MKREKSEDLITTRNESVVDVNEKNRTSSIIIEMKYDDNSLFK